MPRDGDDGPLKRRNSMSVYSSTVDPLSEYFFFHSLSSSSSSISAVKCLQNFISMFDSYSNRYERYGSVITRAPPNGSARHKIKIHHTLASVAVQCFALDSSTVNLPIFNEKRDIGCVFALLEIRTQHSNNSNYGCRLFTN